MGYKILTWDEFREVCTKDAYNWIHCGYTADELTESDIISEYSDDYFDSEYQETDELSSCFTPHDFAEKTIDYIRELQEV